MTDKLVAVRASSLPNAEFGQLTTRLLKDWDESLISLKDEISNTTLGDLRTTLDKFNKAQEKVDLTQSTADLVRADEERDDNVRALFSSIRLFASSRDILENKAYQSLTKLFNDYRKVTSASYEKETAKINHLLEQLKDETLTDYIKLLGADRFVTRLETSQNAFEDIFHNRTKGTTVGHSQTVKDLRRELNDIYRDFAEHIAIAARRSKNTDYIQALEIVNRSRKNFADSLAIRKGQSKKKKAKINTPSETKE